MVGTPLPDDAIDDDLQYRIGRNLLVFQRIEANLKKLMSVNRIAFEVVPGMTDEDVLRAFQQSLQSRTNERNRQTLGTLTGDYKTEVLGQEAGDPNPPPGGALVSFGYQRTEAPDLETALSQRMSEIVAERNTLAHHLLDKLGTGTPEQLEDTRRWLDQQHAQAILFLGELRDELRCLGESRLALIDHLRNTDLRAMFEHAWLAQSPLADHFTNAARRTMRNDGWTVFSTAAGTAHTDLAEELGHLKERYGHARLLPAVEAIGLFKFTEEDTPRGRRLLYRLREEPTLQLGQVLQTPEPPR